MILAIIAGLLIDHFGWPSVFLMNLPACALALLLGLRLLPQSQPSERRRFDWIGLALLTLASVAVVEATSTLQRQGLANATTLGFAGLAVANLLFFVAHARRTPSPIISLKPFTERTFAMGSLVTFSYGFGLYA